jgi:alkylation response protein AidB-like acyl-CoA dehydrogenase
MNLDRSLTYYAAWCCDEEPAEAALAVSAAKPWCGDTYKSATVQSIQIHGGIGFTWEANLHLWYRRAFWSSAFLGDPVYHRERVTQLAGI